MKSELEATHQLLQITKEENLQQIRHNEHSKEQIVVLNKDINGLEEELKKMHSYNKEISKNYCIKEEAYVKTIRDK